MYLRILTFCLIVLTAVWPLGAFGAVLHSHENHPLHAHAIATFSSHAALHAEHAGEVPTELTHPRFDEDRPGNIDTDWSIQLNLPDGATATGSVSAIHFLCLRRSIAFIQVMGMPPLELNGQAHRPHELFHAHLLRGDLARIAVLLMTNHAILL